MAKQKLTVKALMGGVKESNNGRFQFVIELGKRQRVITVGEEYARLVASRLVANGVEAVVEDTVTHAIYGVKVVEKSAHRLAGTPVVTWQVATEIDGRRRYPRGVNPFVEPEPLKA